MDDQLLEQMPIEEFIRLPNTIQVIIRYTPGAELIIGEIPYLRIGTIIYGGNAIAYIQTENLFRLVAAFKTSEINLLPMVMTIMGERDLAAAGILQAQRQPYLNLTGSGVLIGFVDTGIDYKNNAFIYEDGTTKIKYLWDQSIEGKSPAGYHFGAEYTENEINEALNSADSASVVPEADTVGHGTFLASIAAGRESGEFAGAAPDAELLVVKLRDCANFYREYFLVPESKQNVYSSGDVMLGINYLFEKANELHRPLVLCVAVGTNLGSHDGLNIMESWLMYLCDINATAICMAPGNESNRQHHASGKLTSSGQSAQIEFRTDSIGEPIFICAWTGPSDTFSASITSPVGETVGPSPFKAGLITSGSLVLEDTFVSIEYVYPAQGEGSQLTIIRIITPTPGIWTLTLYGEKVIDGIYNVWLPASGLGNDTTLFLSPDPYLTIVTPANACGTITAGAYNSQFGGLYESSSWGPTRLNITSPALVAPGVDVRGTYPNNEHGSMSGTSVSAAIAAGAAALTLQWAVIEKNQPVISSFTTRSFLIKGCVVEQNMQVPNNQWGYGKLNLMQSFIELT